MFADKIGVSFSPKPIFWISVLEKKSINKMSEKTLLGPGSRVEHPAFGIGVVLKLHLVAYEICFVKHGIKLVGKDYDNWATIIEALPAEEIITFTEAEKSLVRILKTFDAVQEIVPLGEKWRDGVMILKSGDASMQPKEVPIDTFFHKIVMMRDRLRVLEQQINAHQKLSDEDKVNLQQYITRCYGSMKTFNILFKNREDYFTGESSK